MIDKISGSLEIIIFIVTLISITATSLYEYYKIRKKAKNNKKKIKKLEGKLQEKENKLETNKEKLEELKNKIEELEKNLLKEEGIGGRAGHIRELYKKVEELNEKLEKIIENN